MNNNQSGTDKQKSKRTFWLPATILVTAAAVITALTVNLESGERNLGKQIESLETKANQAKEKSSSPDKGIKDSEYLTTIKDIAGLKKEQFTLHTNMFLIILQTISGLAIFGGFYFTWKSQKDSNERAKSDFELAEDRLINERFEKAVEHLGNDKCATRLGGMYTLHSIAAKYPEQYCDEGLNILAAFIQDRCAHFEDCLSSKNINGITYITDGERSGKKSDSGIFIDIQTCFSMIGELTKQKQGGISEISLRRTNLIGLQIKSKEFHLMVELSSAYLSRVDFTMTKFLDARFMDSTLANVCFDSTELECSSFQRSTMQDVSFRDAKLKNTLFNCSKIQATSFERAKLAQANFEKAELKKVVFKDAVLEKAMFKDVDLQDTDITEEQLSVALLWNTTLPGGVISNRDRKEIEKMQEIPQE